MTNAVYKAIADPTRREILELLSGAKVSDAKVSDAKVLGASGLSVQEIADHFTMSRPAISKHLKILKEARLVGERPDGRQRFYEVEAGPLAGVGLWLAGFGAVTTPGASGAEAEDPASERLSRDEFEDQWGDRLAPSAGKLAPAAREDWRVW